jgi:hypothetical protein
MNHPHKTMFSAIGLAFILLASISTLAISTPNQAFAHKEHTDFITNAEYIKGHLEQAVADKQANDIELASAHAGHPIAEVYTLMEEPLSEKSQQRASSLKQALEALQNSVKSDTPQVFAQKVTEINGMLDEAVQVVAGDEAKEVVAKATVIKNLLETAEHEYEEGVQGGKVVAMVEYQDATGFISRADAVFKTIQSQINEHEAEETAEFFEKLNSLTKSNADIEEVETVIGGIVHEFEEALGLEEGGGEQELDGWGRLDKIVQLLDQSVTEYKAGNAQKAKALAIEAYLDNYEYVEDDINEENPQLMKQIELEMREQLVAMIDQKKPVSEVESHVDKIKTDIQTARAIVTPEFPVAAVAAISALMAFVVVIGRFKGQRLFGTRSLF